MAGQDRTRAYCAVLALLVRTAGAAAAPSLSFYTEGNPERIQADPLLYRANLASQYATADLGRGALPEADTVALAQAVIPGAEGSSSEPGITVACTSGSVYHLIIAFQVHENSTVLEGLQGGEQQALPWLEAATGLNGISAAAPVAEVINGLDADLRRTCDGALAGGIVSIASATAEGDSAEAVSTSILTSFGETFGGANEPPYNILVTGAGSAGSLAIVVAAWAAVNYPFAHILLQTFGAEWPSSSGRFNWTVSQFVDQYYFWPDDEQLEGFGDSQRLADTNFDEVMAVLGDEASTDGIDVGELASDMRGVMQYATTVHIKAADGTDLTFRNSASDDAALSDNDKDELSTMEMPDWSNSTYEQQLQDTAEAYMSSLSECPLGLCKSRLPLLLAGGIYSVGGESSPITEIFPSDSRQLEGENSADAVIGWDAENRVAFIVAEGTQGVQDAMIDVRFLQRDYPLPKAYAKLFDKPEVAAGFREQFLELTSDASDENSVEVQLKAMMGEATPRLIIVTGHSLGAALATLLAPWSSSVWPKATVLTVTSGSPKLGDAEFKNYYRQTVGRQWRYVQEHDVVPTQPPLDYVKHIENGLWIRTDGRVIAGDRPPLDVGELSVENHNSYLYSIIPSEAANITIPGWVLQLDNEEASWESGTVEGAGLHLLLLAAVAAVLCYAL